jgi:hypothetical protein
MMKSVADKLWGDLLKSSVGFPVPSLSASHFFELSFAQAILAFAAASSPTTPTVADYIAESSVAARKPGIVFLIGPSDKVIDGCVPE